MKKRVAPASAAALAVLALAVALSGCSELFRGESTPVPTFVPTLPPQPSPTLAPSPSPTEPPTLVAHEWGVLLACADSNDAFATNRPEQRLLVRQPVVYFHNASNASFQYSVKFASGKATKTIPDAGDGESVSWNVKKAGVETPAARAQQQLVSEEEMLAALQTNSSDEIEANGERARFLFYEGETKFKNEVAVSSDGTTAVFKNNGKYEVSTVQYYEHRVQGSFATTLQAAFISTLAPNQTASAPLTAINYASIEKSLKNDLRAQGFEEDEASAFAKFWVNDVAYPARGRKNLFYRLPREKYDELLPARITPAPAEFKRTLYVLVDAVN